MPQHKPEALFDESKQVVSSRLIDGCAKWNMEIEKATESQVVCSIPDASFSSLMSTSRYSTIPKLKETYTIYTVNGKTKVRTSLVSESINAYGQVRRTDKNDQETKNTMRKYLISLGGK